MKEISNATFATLLKELPVLLDRCNVAGSDVKGCNARQRVRRALKTMQSKYKS